VERLEELQSTDGPGKRRKSEQPEEELAARLAKLKDVGEVPHEEDLAVRLAKLKGEAPPTAGPHTVDGKSIHLTQKPESEKELLERLAKQVEVDKNYETGLVDDIESRLAKLKGGVPTSSSSLPSSSSTKTLSLEPDDELGEEEQVEQIMSRYIAEALLRQKSESIDQQDEGEGSDDETEAGGAEEDSEDDEDLDFEKLCRICEEKRATINCVECDGDIFCKKCFKEFHEELGETHKPTTIRKSEEH